MDRMDDTVMGWGGTVKMGWGWKQTDEDGVGMGQRVIPVQLSSRDQRATAKPDRQQVAVKYRVTRNKLTRGSFFVSVQYNNGLN